MPRTLDVRVPVSLLVQAGRGQMALGGRSCPSDWKSGAGALRAGNTTEATGMASGADGSSVTIAAA